MMPVGDRKNEKSSEFRDLYEPTQASPSTYLCQSCSSSPFSFTTFHEVTLINHQASFQPKPCHEICGDGILSESAAVLEPKQSPSKNNEMNSVRVHASEGINADLQKLNTRFSDSSPHQFLMGHHCEQRTVYFPFGSWRAYEQQRLIS